LGAQASPTPRPHYFVMIPFQEHLDFLLDPPPVSTFPPPIKLAVDKVLDLLDDPQHVRMSASLTLFSLRSVYTHFPNSPSLSDKTAFASVNRLRLSPSPSPT